MAEQPGLRFGRVAEEYERVRPGYSDTLVDRAYSLAGLRQGDTVGEIGCGTGKLTRALTARGLAVEAVEPDPDLIAVARRIVPEQAVRFHQARFEDAELPEGSFPAVSPPRASTGSILRSGGARSPASSFRAASSPCSPTPETTSPR